MPISMSRRRVAATIAMAVATVAVLATSQARVDIGDTTEGPPLQVTPGEPAAAIGFVVDANDVALEAGLASLTVGWDLFWSGLPSGVDPELTPEILKTAGPGLVEPAFRGSMAEELYCLGSDCLGTYQLIFTWPADLEAGTVRIAWRVTANVSFESGSPPDGAQVDVRVEQASDGRAPLRIFADQISVGRDRSIVVDSLRLTSESAIPAEGRLAVELGEPRSNYGRGEVSFTLLQNGEEPFRLRPASSTPLIAPPRCRTGPCSFSITLVTELRVVEDYLMMAATVSWGITSQGIPARIDVTREEDETATITSRIALGRVRLESDGGHVDRVTIRFPAAAFPRAEFGAAHPIIQARLTLNAVRESLDFPSDGTLFLSFSFPSTPPGGDLSFGLYRQPFSFDEDRPEYPESFAVPNTCRSERPCRVEIAIELAGDARGEPFEGLIELDPTLDLEVSYPITGVVPVGASFDVALERDG
jgi:hypothetical protein